MRDLIEALELFIEARADLARQAVVLMGLPAAGKSTFVNNELSRYVPGFKAPKVENSDVQVKATQRVRANEVYARLKRAAEKGDDSYARAVERLEYKSNTGSVKRIRTPVIAFRMMKNSTDLFRAEYNGYFATWFDMRDAAKATTASMFGDKVSSAGDGLVIDTVAATPSKILSKLKKTKEKGMTNSIFYLEVDPELSIIRDKYRGKTEGRSVGEGVIMGYAGKMKGAFDEYMADAKDPNGVVDRVYHFVWKQQGDDPVKGTWTLKKQYKGDVVRDLRARKANAKKAKSADA